MSQELAQKVKHGGLLAGMSKPKKSKPAKHPSWGASRPPASPAAAEDVRPTTAPTSPENGVQGGAISEAERSGVSADTTSGTNTGFSTATGSPSSSYMPSPCPSDATSTRSATVLGHKHGVETDRIEVVVYSASGLLGKGLKDMFISMKLGDFRCTTKAKSPSPTAAPGGSLVTWGQTFRMPHYEPLRSLSLRVRLYAKKGLGMKHMVGEAHIHLRDLIEAPQSRMHQTWPLSGVVGQVELKLAQL